LNVPTYASVIEDVRDYSIVDLPLPIRHQANRIAIIFDHSRDQRVFNVLSSIWYRDLKTGSHIIGLGEAKGVLTVWYGLPHTEPAQHAIQAACDAALRPRDRWPVEVHSAPILAGVLNRTLLAADHPLLIIPERFPLGLVRV
jgi:hypothetical protein